MLNQVRNRLQFVIVLALFYPTMLELFFRSMQQEYAGSFTLLKWGGVISVLIFNYLILEVTASRLTTRMLRLIDVLLLTEIAAFVPVFMVFGMIQSGHVSIVWSVAYILGFAFSLAIPLLTVIILGAHMNWLLFTDIFADLKTLFASTAENSDI